MKASFVLRMLTGVLVVMALFAPAARAGTSVVELYGPYYNAEAPRYFLPESYTFIAAPLTQVGDKFEVAFNITPREFPPIELPPGETCVCGTHGPNLSSRKISFSLLSATPATFSADTWSGSPTPGSENTLFYGDPRYWLMSPGSSYNVAIGELEILDINGIKTVSRFAADFNFRYPPFPGGDTTDTWISSSFRYNSDTAPFAYLAPIPEPESWPMLLAGITVIGLRRRRD